MNVTRNLLTIISITKNDIEGIRKTINSTRELRTSYNVEQLIVDSSDEYDAIQVKSITLNEKNMSLISCKEQGISRAFNVGIEQSRSIWILFLNGGDEILPELVNVDYDSIIYLLQKSTSDLLVFQIKFRDRRTIFSNTFLRDNWPIIHNLMPHPSSFIRRSLFDTYGMYNEDYKSAMDLEFWSRIGNEKINVNNISIPIVLFGEDGISSKKNVLTNKEQKIISRKYLKNNIRKLLGKIKIVIETSF